ncbi:ArnT family glycosyltransferase [Swingsia samuiensis]|uniref:Glycosyltransferase family 39 protein n=1 Tax=Swingsia samuiensis TaxID=1293412 RepID=A0A4Y6UHG3_9PROT|nr:glycosyltransferase family 39 protein [Swingsia samuiensis]QDH16942.1 glycosyltransferase family 39 protein [Swingsia samuiensis]
MKLTFRHYALLGIVAFLLALAGRTTLPPLDRDEPRYMEASEQMITSGNYIDVRFQDKPRYLQPAGIYWLEVASTKISQHILGPQVLRQTWPYRIPSLIAAALIIPLTAWLGCLLFDGITGLLAAGLLMTSTLFVAESHMATIDTVLLLDILSTEILIFLTFKSEKRNTPTPLPIAIGYWVTMGLGLMLKGPVVLIPGLATPICLSFLEKNYRWLKGFRPQWGWLVMFAIVLPWCIAIEIVSHGDFFSKSIGRNFLGKVAHGQEAHGLPPGFHLAVFALAFWPGSFFTALALPKIWKNRNLTSVKFLISWIIPHWLVFEAIATKLPHYVLPTYPAIAILTAASLTVWKQMPLPRWAKFLFSLYGLIWISLGLSFCFAGSILLYTFEHSFSLTEGLAVIGATPLMIGAILLIYRKKHLQAAFCAIGTAIIAQAGLFLGVIPHLEAVNLSPRVAQAFETIKPCPESILVSPSYSEPSLVFLAGEKTKLLNIEDSAHYIQQNPKCSLLLIDKKDISKFNAYMEKSNLTKTTYGSIKGVNYSNGHHLDLTFFYFK